MLHSLTLVIHLSSEETLKLKSSEHCSFSISYHVTSFFHSLHWLLGHNTFSLCMFQFGSSPKYLSYTSALLLEACTRQANSFLTFQK